MRKPDGTSVEETLRIGRPSISMEDVHAAGPVSTLGGMRRKSVLPKSSRSANSAQQSLATINDADSDTCDDQADEDGVEDNLFVRDESDDAEPIVEARRQKTLETGTARLEQGQTNIASTSRIESRNKHSIVDTTNTIKPRSEPSIGSAQHTARPKPNSDRGPAASHVSDARSTTTAPVRTSPRKTLTSQSRDKPSSANPPTARRTSILHRQSQFQSQLGARKRDALSDIPDPENSLEGSAVPRVVSGAGKVREGVAGAGVGRKVN